MQNRRNAYKVRSTKLLLENGFTTVNYVIRELLKTSNRKFGSVLLNLELAVIQNLSWKSSLLKKNQGRQINSSYSLVSPFFLWKRSTPVIQRALRESATLSPVNRSGGSLTLMDPDRTKSVSHFLSLHRRVLGNAWKYSFVCLCLCENYRCLWGWASKEQRLWRLCFGSWLPTWWLNA